MQIIRYQLKESQYVKEKTNKTGIVFHHTAGNKSALSVAKDWDNDRRGKVATCYIIGYEGEVVQCFDESHWAYALGIGNSKVEQSLIQIELCSWGFLDEKNGKFYNYVGMEIPSQEVELLSLSFKGYKAYHRYSDAQLKSLRELVEGICQRNGIKGHLSISDFKLSKYALSGGKGFFTHNSYRLDKSDVYPSKRLLELFKKGWGIYSS